MLGSYPVKKPPFLGLLGGVKQLGYIPKIPIFSLWTDLSRSPNVHLPQRQAAKQRMCSGRQSQENSRWCRILWWELLFMSICFMSLFHPIIIYIPLLGTNIYPPKALLKMIFLFRRWDPSVPGRIIIWYIHVVFLWFAFFFGGGVFLCGWSFSHSPGSVQNGGIFEGGNYYWRDPLFTSMIMGRRVVCPICQWSRGLYTLSHRLRFLGSPSLVWDNMDQMMFEGAQLDPNPSYSPGKWTLWTPNKEVQMIFRISSGWFLGKPAVTVPGCVSSCDLTKMEVI